MAYNSNIIIPIHYWLFDIEVTNVTTMMLHPAPTRYKWQIMNHENSAAQVFRIYTLFTCVSSSPHLSRSLSLYRPVILFATCCCEHQTVLILFFGFIR